jgi:hypothetical protein
MTKQAPAWMADWWQPIDTAPRDGSLILARNAAHGFMYVVGWRPAAGDEESHWDDVGGGLQQPALYFNANYFQHWMSLPPPPRSQ